jgi:hypothetical protein
MTILIIITIFLQGNFINKNTQIINKVYNKNIVIGTNSKMLFIKV